MLCFKQSKQGKIGYQQKVRANRVKYKEYCNKEQLLAGFYRIMKNLGYKRVFAVTRSIRNRMTDFPFTGDPRNIKVRTQHVKGIHKKKAEAANQIGANSCPNVVGS